MMISYCYHPMESFPMFRESEYKVAAGLPALLFFLAVIALAVTALVRGAGQPSPVTVLTAILVIVFAAVMLAGLFIVNPGEAKALVLFGDYRGTVKRAGFWFANPFLTKKRISLRVRNFETAKLKVNDARANPIEIAAI